MKKNFLSIKKNINVCHKSQGSEWDKVLIYEEKFPFDKEEHKRWLYTACTRAAEKLVLVRP